MDFFRALLEPTFSETSALKPRVPALFESGAPRVDMPLEESFEADVNEPARDANTTRVAPQNFRQDVSREPETYRGVMNVLPLLHETDTPAAPSSQNNAPRIVQPLAKDTNDSPTSRVIHETREPSETRSLIQSETRVEPPSPRTAIVPAQIFESRIVETDKEKTQEAKAESAPVVRINIGRIVVRAVSETPPAPPKRESKSKKMSLDDYLKKRERGER